MIFHIYLDEAVQKQLEPFARLLISKARCWLAIATADQQKPDAGLQSQLLISKSQMLACNRNCWSAKARCRLAIAIADQQKPNAGLQSRLRVSKGQMLACNRDCGSARAKCWLTIAIADQQEPNAGLQSRFRVSKSQMPACIWAELPKNRPSGQ